MTACLRSSTASSPNPPCTTLAEMLGRVHAQSHMSSRALPEAQGPSLASSLLREAPPPLRPPACLLLVPPPCLLLVAREPHLSHTQVSFDLSNSMRVDLRDGWRWYAVWLSRLGYAGLGQFSSWWLLFPRHGLRHCTRARHLHLVGWEGAASLHGSAGRGPRRQVALPLLQPSC